MSTDRWDSMSQEDKDGFVDALISFMKMRDRMEAMSDVALIEAVVEQVWGKMAWSSEEENLLDELISRFEKRCGIQRDDEGKPVTTP